MRKICPDHVYVLEKTYVFIIPILVQCFGPFNPPVCTAIIFASRFTYILIMSLLTMHQVIKFLYIFKWKIIVGLNEVFVALFITVDAIALSFLAALALKITDRKEVATFEYYLCIGHYPLSNVSAKIATMQKSSEDKIHKFSYLVFAIIFILT